MPKLIICDHCLSTDVELIRGQTAEVQEITADGVPIGEKKFYLCFICHTCGEDFYVEKSEEYVN